MKKRIANILLFLCMLIVVICTTAFADEEPDTTAPVLTAGDVKRSSDTAAEVKFTSSENGTYYYDVVDAGADAPDFDTSVDGIPCGTEEQTLSITLTAGEKDVYILVKDAAGNESLPLKITVPEFVAPPVNVYDACDGITDTTALPADFVYTLGSEGLFYDPNIDSSLNFYGKIIKIDNSQEFSKLNVSFTGKDENLDTVIRIFYYDYGSYDLLNESNSGSLSTVLTNSGTYYIALTGKDETVTGECRAEISIEPGEGIVPLEEGFKELTDAASLPAEFDYVLGSEEKYYSAYNSDYGWTFKFLAKLMKVELEANSVLSVSFAGAGDSVDTVLWLYSETDGVLSQVDFCDDDDMNESGEKERISLTKAGTYYIALAGYGAYDTGLCHAKVDVESYPDAKECSLDFTLDPVPVPEEGDKWSWDPESRTLTLKDGFSIQSPDKCAITLPDNSTVKVEGRASILTDWEGIIGKNITVRGAEGSKLIISADEDGIISENILIEDVELRIWAGLDGLDAAGNITVRRSVLDIESEYEGMDVPNAGNTITVENSTLKIVSDEEGIDISEGAVIFTDSDVDIDTTSDEEGIDAFESSIVVTGGRLVIAAKEDAICGDKITLTDVVFDLRTTDSGYPFLTIGDPESFSLPGYFRLYDFDGNMLYEGPWTDELLKEKDLYVNDIPVYRAVSIHEHSWSKDWTSDDTHHWHECTSPYCTLTDNSEKDGYSGHEGELRNAKAATETQNGYTGDMVCKICGKLLSSGQEIKATGKQPTAPGNNPGAGSSDSSKPSTLIPATSVRTDSVSTGDNSNVLVWMALILISCTGAAAMTAFIRRRIAR